MTNNLSLEFAGLGGTNKFIRYIGETRLFYPAPWGTVISLHGAFGYIQSLGDVPIDEKFYLGGINTLRGYNGRTVSPYTSSLNPVTNGKGEVYGNTIFAFLGGDTETYFNVDYLFPIIKEAGLKGVLFVDAGNSYDGLDKLFTRVQVSYGFGFRWNSPMGPLRMEYGIPYNPREGIDKKSGRIEFSMGSFF